MKFTTHICTHANTHTPVHTHTNVGQSAWHQTAVHGQMRCVRAPCCQEADRKKKQTLSNGDMTCSPGRKLKQTFNGPWSLQYSSKIPTTAPPLCSPSLSGSVPCWPRGSDISRPNPLPRGDIFLPPPSLKSTEIPHRKTSCWRTDSGAQNQSSQSYIHISTFSLGSHWFRRQRRSVAI